MVHTVNILSNLTTWLELYSNETKVNIFKIPLLVIATKGNLLSKNDEEREKTKIKNQLKNILNCEQQLLFASEGQGLIKEKLNNFYSDILQERAMTLQNTHCLLW